MIEHVSRMYDGRYQEGSISDPAMAAYSRIAKVLRDTFNPTFAMDVGCGGGALVVGLQSYGVFAYGVEGSAYAYNLLPDLITLHDLTEPYTLSDEIRYDLITCFDVGEHIPEEHVEVFVRNIVHFAHANSTIVFGAAHIGQDGHGHVNCQHPVYWLERFLPYQWLVDPAKSEEVRRRITAQPGTDYLWWVPRNLMVLRRSK